MIYWQFLLHNFPPNIEIVNMSIDSQIRQTTTFYFLYFIFSYSWVKCFWLRLHNEGNKYFYEHQHCFDKSVSFNYHKIKSKGSMAPAKRTLNQHHMYVHVHTMSFQEEKNHFSYPKNRYNSNANVFHINKNIKKSTWI